MVQIRTTTNKKFRRDAWVEINLDNLEYNLKSLYVRFKKPLIPVLKADAYGHGASVIAKTLENYDFVIAYAVASLDEALELKQIVPKKRIIILGISPEWALEEALVNEIELTVSDVNSAEQVNQIASRLNKQAKIHIKIDTGMNRIGFKSLTAEGFHKEIKRIEQLSNLQIMSLFTHFSDLEDFEFAQQQKTQFEFLTEGLNYPKHPGSSLALKAVAGLDFDYVRCGIELYGLESSDMKPVLGLYARISYLKSITSGEPVSYKQTWRAKEDSRIITLPLGYADGISRALSNKIQAYYKDSYINQVGLITMDQMMFVLGQSGASVGDIVELLGPHCPVSSWASAIGTISYEIVSALNLRLPKTYTRN